LNEYCKSFIQVLYTSDFGHRWYFGERSFWNIPTVVPRKMSKDYRKTTTIYGNSVRPGDLTPNGRKTFETFYNFLIIFEI